MADGYKEIETYLLKELPETDDVKANFERVQQWLSEKEENICDEGECSRSDEDEAIEDFVNLYLESKGRDKCSSETINILRKNRDAVRYGKVWYLGTEETSRVSSLIRAIADQLASECVPQIQEKFVRRFKSLDQEQLLSLDESLDQLMKPLLQSLDESTTELPSWIRFNRQFLFYFDSCPYMDSELINTSSLLAKEQLGDDIISTHILDEQERLQIAEEKALEFVDEFFCNPCEYFTENMQDLLDPMLDYVKIDRSYQVSWSNVEFFFAIGKFKWCLDILEHPDWLAEGIAARLEEPEFSQMD